MRLARPPSYVSLLTNLAGERLVQLLQSDVVENPAEYVHWDKLRHRKPPRDLSHDEWWFVIKSSRRRADRPLPLTDRAGLPFTYSTPDVVQRLLHDVDQRCSGQIAMPEIVIGDEQARQHYLVNSLMEEAIRSSQLEGAITSRRVAKDLLRSGRAPKDRSERMILNNYRGLQFMREMGDVLEPEAVLELHRILTEGTLDEPGAAGRLQRPDEERVVVKDRLTDDVVHVPPPAEQLPERLEQMCAFANTGLDSPQFVHPVVRAILLHFWLAYDHPFEDGNGRTARALFYWYMRIQGYWLAEYLSISRILRDAPSQYSKSFLQTESDDRDTTYFLVYQLHVIQRAIDEFHAYLKRKVDEIRDAERLVKGSSNFNRRQLALLGHALRTVDETYTFRSHGAAHGVTHETARNDILPLVEKGLLKRHPGTGRHYFSPVLDLADRLRALH